MRPHRLAALFVFLFLTGSAVAQIRITDVVNAGSRLATASRFGGIAQGAVFAVTGRALGPADFLQATFPLPTTDGLGGVTIQAAVSGAIVDCIMVYVKPIEVAAILPSATPIGRGTITVNNNGATATAPINVVAAAFGIFTLRPGFGAAPAAAFNVTEDGTPAPNTALQSAQAGQDMLINGTGLGAISSDETQSGVTDVPSTAIQVYVGVKPAVVVSAGRGACCDGLDPAAFPIPQGIAAWDVIRFTIPDGVIGCYIPVVVQIGNLVSNLASIAIGAGGAPCPPPVSTLPLEIQQALAGKTGVSLGNINLSRITGMNPNAAGAVVTAHRDTGGVSFVRYNNVPASMFAADYKYPENVCSINGYPGPTGGVVVNGTETPIVPLVAVPLDAGAAITVTGPSGTRSIPRQMAGMIVAYRAMGDFGNSTPGNYYDPGRYTATGPGGRDVGAFTASIDVPATPFVWTSIPNILTPLDRSKDLTLTWTGGTPGTQVTVEGAGFAAGVTAAFLCAAPVSAGQLTIPSYVLLSLPPTSPTSIVPGSLAMQNRFVTTFTAPGLDIAAIAYSAGYSLSLKFE